MSGQHFQFVLELQGGPLSQPTPEAALMDALARYCPNVVFSRYQGRELARCSRRAASLSEAGLITLRELRMALPEVRLVDVRERPYEWPDTP